MLPGINIKFDNGNIGSVVPTADGVFGLLASAVAVAEGLELNKAYLLKGMSDVAKLGILPDVNNYHLYKKLARFYAEAGEGTELWLYAFAKDTKVSDWFTPDVGTGIVPAQALLDASNGAICALWTCFVPDENYVITVEDSLDADVWVAKVKAQTFAENYTKNSYAPFFVILEGYAYDGDDIALQDLNESDQNRVGIFIGASEPKTGDVMVIGAGSENLLGRLALVPVQENAGRVKRGPLNTLKAYLIDEPIETADVTTLHNKGYITFRTHARKSGYYISDDPLATDAKDDYRQINRRRVIDKAYRLAHNIASNEILEDFDLLNDGTISPLYAKTVEGNIEREIFNQMTSNGELSRDQTNKDDLGVIAKFDTTANVAQTSRIELTIKVRPKGTARFFDILLGYDVNLNN